MLTTELKVEIFKYFTKSYAELLEKFIYKDKKLVNQLLKSPKNKDAYESLVVHYFNAITDFYRRYPDGTYLEELEYVKNNPQVKKSAKEYLDLTGDETLIRFLQVYSYCVQEPSGLIYD